MSHSHDPEHYLRIAAEHSSDVVLVADADGRHLWASPSAYDVLGYRPEEMVGRDASDFVTPDVHEKILAGRAKAGDRRSGLDEVRVRKADGSSLWMSSRSTPCELGGGQGRVISLRDATEQVRARRALADAEARYRMLAENASDVVCLADGNHALQWVSPTVSQVLGWHPTDLTGHTLAEFMHPDDRLVASILGPRGYAASGHDDTPRTTLVRLRTRDGHHRWMSSVCRRVTDGDTLSGVVTSLRDVHEIIEARHEAERAAETVRVILNATPDAIAAFDPQLRLQHVNQRLLDLLGRSAQQCVGRTLEELHFHTSIVDEVETAVRQTFHDGEQRRLELDFVLGTEHLWFESTIAPVRCATGAVEQVISFNRDVTQRHLAEEQLTNRALRDQLTGLANRSALLDELTRALASARRCRASTAVLMIDLDHFKYVNDSLGHGVGDELLIGAANRLAASVRANDLVARLGGDEFVVVMRDLGESSDAMLQGQRIVDQFRRPLCVNGVDLYTTASIGIATSVGDHDAGDLLRDADTALYVAKELGRDRVAAYTTALREAVTHRLDLGVQLRPALERDEFEVWYQPEVDLVSGEVIAVEALLRWHRADGELYAADHFIDVAEETGLLPDIGDFVLFEACQQTAAWNRTNGGAPLTVRVNLSANQLAEPRLLLTLDEVLVVSGLDPNLLCLELTETAILRDNHTAKANLAALHARGIRVCIDDFGIGYASLAYLRDLPVDVIKIDRSFIANIATDERDVRIVGGIVALADRLGISVTAEGVEHAEQVHVLREARCAAGQGYHFARPMRADDVPWFVQQQRAGLVQR